LAIHVTIFKKYYLMFMKIAAIDLGDRHIGIALSDASKIISFPYTTVTPSELDEFLKKFILKENVSLILVGHPRTLKGTKSEQTLKVEKEFERLCNVFQEVQWKLIDERLSSKHANNIIKAKTKEEKLKSHSIVASLLLESFLQFLDKSF
jgi:putative Holliday junction resolvase